MQELIERLGHTFDRPELLVQALTHKSFRNEQPAQANGDNERLEFLGDAVLELALSDLLMARFSVDQEGSLSKKRASLVNEEQLATLARSIGVDGCLRLGKGERQSGGLQKPRILASAFEAVLGAIFLDQGYPASHATVERLFTPLLATFENGAADFARDYKTRLQEYAQEKFRLTPTYHLEQENGPDHEKVFEISVRLEVGGGGSGQARVLAAARGRSKKGAEQEAARLALVSLGVSEGDTPRATLTEQGAAMNVNAELKNETQEVPE